MEKKLWWKYDEHVMSSHNKQIWSTFDALKRLVYEYHILLLFQIMMMMMIILLKAWDKRLMIH